MKKPRFERAGYLLVGSNYLLRMHPDDHGLPVFTRVKFVDLTNCPAVVVVQDDRKDRIVCNRSDLYLYPAKQCRPVESPV